jgi:biopolymer transport protein ExbB
MSKPNNAPAKNSGSATGTSENNEWFAPAVMIISLIVAELVFHMVMGKGSNFDGNDPVKGHPLNALGIIYKGGFIVPLLMTMALCVIVFSVERILTLRAAQGKGSVPEFIKKVQASLNLNNVDSAIAECDKQKGSVANVVRSGLVKYKEMASNTELEKDQKIAAIQQEIEESTALEMPMLEQNMPVLSTIASVGTLVALLGTVIGMIKAFSGMATAGAPDAVALSTGISEALINTALGIGTSAVAIIMYNYFTAKIDGLSYRIDEAAFSMSQTFATHNK